MLFKEGQFHSCDPNYAINVIHTHTYQETSNMGTPTPLSMKNGTFNENQTLTETWHANHGRSIPPTPVILAMQSM